MKICEFGCEKESKFILKNGKNCCSTHYNKCEGKRLKNSITAKNLFLFNGNIERLDYIFKVKILKLLKFKAEICFYGCDKQYKFILPNGNLCCENNYNKCIAKIKSSANKHKGSKRTEETKKCLSIIHTKRMEDVNIRKNLSIKIKNLYKNKDYVKKRNKCLCNVKNKQEIFLEELLNNNFKSYNFKYVGDYSTWINGKNPDFINDNNKIIELFGDYWHSEKFVGQPKDLHEKNRIEHFKKENYQCLIIWENELKNTNNVINKIKTFLGETIC